MDGSSPSLPTMSDRYKGMEPLTPYEREEAESFAPIAPRKTGVIERVRHWLSIAGIVLLTGFLLMLFGIMLIVSELFCRRRERDCEDPEE